MCEIFYCLSIASVHHKLNGARLLSPEIKYMNCHTSCQMTQGLENEDILGKYQN